ncbi:MAG: hypothetical protein R2705_20815 [Ilumatobacteraceae bacterium]
MLPVTGIDAVLDQSASDEPLGPHPVQVSHTSWVWQAELLVDDRTPADALLGLLRAFASDSRRVCCRSGWSPADRTATGSRSARRSIPHRGRRCRPGGAATLSVPSTVGFQPFDTERCARELVPFDLDTLDLDHVVEPADRRTLEAGLAAVLPWPGAGEEGFEPDLRTLCGPPASRSCPASTSSARSPASSSSST